jgi:hypothetical protein
MIRIAITGAAFEAIAATMPLGSVAVEPQVDAKGVREIWLKPRVVDWLRGAPWPGARLCSVAAPPVRVVKLKTGT